MTPPWISTLIAGVRTGEMRGEASARALSSEIIGVSINVLQDLVAASA